MLAFLKSILAARTVAAAIGVLTTAIAFAILPGLEYSLAAVAIAFAAVGTVLLFMPFTKYVLVSRDATGIEATFWALQPIAVPVMLGMGYVGSLFSPGIDPGLAICGALLGASQGWKEFTGESLRVREDAPGLARLYVSDATTTLLLTTLMLQWYPRAETLLLASAASSMWWAVRGSSRTGWKWPRLSEVGRIYRYSFGVVASGSLNAAAIGTIRAAAHALSPAAIAGAVQFLLDLLQKSMALYASSVLSAAIPHAVRNGMASVNGQVWQLMIAAAVAAAVAAMAAAFAYVQFGDSAIDHETALMIAVCCALFVWANRFKSTLSELPLLCAERFVDWLVPGSMLAFGGTLAAAAFAPTTWEALLAGAASILAGGAVAAWLGVRHDLCGQGHAVATSSMLALPIGGWLLGKALGIAA